MRTFNDELTQREIAQHEQEKEILTLQGEFSLKSKQLEVEVLKLDTKFGSWLKLPMAIVLLPVKILIILPMLAYAVRGYEIPKEYWEFFKT